MENKFNYNYTYNEFTKDIKLFCELLKEYNPDAILAIARGGVTFGHFLSEQLNIREFYIINSIYYNDNKKLDTIKVFNIPTQIKSTKVLVVDDIVDSGDTMSKVISILTKKFPNTNFKTGAIFYKKDAIYKPDFKLHIATKWVDFFWSKLN